MKVVDILSLQDVLILRARSFQMVEACGYKTSLEYTGKIITLLRAITPKGMRATTLNEARKTDREIMTEILKWVGKGRGTVEAGLSDYMSSPDEPLWKLMAQQPETLPHQGPVKQTHRGSEAREDAGRGQKRPRPTLRSL